MSDLIALAFGVLLVIAFVCTTGIIGVLIIFGITLIDAAITIKLLYFNQPKGLRNV